MDWSWLLVLACPIMMIFMMFGMKGHHGHGKRKEEQDAVSRSEYEALVKENQAIQKQLNRIHEKVHG
ncbi:DUF2933 domain-containing protein [Paenibacillus kribbensis]|uniref:DUF2933 domain-containing protein n=1 Tax=Paenibacillus kribbensis TaxID=172713 RepID=UPI0015BE57E9|nr:DUF2933 domain-containing protein [Paenibacillus kribbensis]